MYLPNFLDGFDRLVTFDAETTGKRTPDAECIRKQPFAWRPPGIIIEVGFVEMLREGDGCPGDGLTKRRRRPGSKSAAGCSLPTARGRRSAWG